ncbi:MAG: amidohydrolase [Candidatus Solibacter usitatus]|nr:amidohydrolase [Candidatus Solibacter usitatus]
MLAKLALVLGVFPAMKAQGEPMADLILRNGKIWTVNDKQPPAQAVACRNGLIVAVGSNGEIDALAGAGTRAIDLKGRLLLPGFNDSHVHFFTGGEELSGVQLRDARSEKEFRDRIAAFARKLPKGAWITGGNWDHENSSPARLPVRQLIDDVTPQNPVFVSRLDGHMALANSVALKMAGITRESKDPPGGTIVRDAKGEPSGVLKDSAMSAVFRVRPAPSQVEIESALRAAMKYAAENGVTSVQDVSAGPEVLRAYQSLLAKNELTVRVNAMQPLSNWARLAAVGLRAGFGGEMLRIGGLKAFYDGSLGSTTAWFFAGYSDAPENKGLPSAEFLSGKLRQDMLAADGAGLQLAIHAIGDRANHEVLTIFEEAMRKNGPRDRRFRIEHAQHLRAEDILRFAKNGVVASMQPYHAIDDGRWADKRIGTERAKGTYAFRSLLDAGVTLAFGSDWFVAPMEPLMGIYGAVTRRTLDGKRPGGWVPEQRITVAEAIRAYTMGSAYASGEEGRKGSVESGKVADFAVLSEDILSIPAERIGGVKVEMTVCGGRIVYER